MALEVSTGGTPAHPSAPSALDYGYGAGESDVG